MNWTQRKTSNFPYTHHVLTLNNGDEIILWRRESKYGVDVLAYYPHDLSSKMFNLSYGEGHHLGRTIRDAKKRVEAYVEYMRGA